MVGAGTVLTYEEAVEAIEAGAAFCCLPRYLKSAYWTCAGARRGVLYRGLFHLRKSDRVFWTGGYCEDIPAGRLGSRYVSDIQAPLGKNAADGRGGIGTSNVQEYFAAGHHLGNRFGIFLKEDILNENEEGMRFHSSHGRENEEYGGKES